MLSTLSGANSTLTAATHLLPSPPSRLGTIDYIAPEILDCPVKQSPGDHKQPGSVQYSNKVDCWSIGVLAYELMAGRAPFAAVSRGHPGGKGGREGEREDSGRMRWCIGTEFDGGHGRAGREGGLYPPF